MDRDGSGARGPHGPRGHDPPTAGGAGLTGPRVTGPRVTGPRVTGPRVTGPRVTGPRVTGPRVTGPRAGVVLQGVDAPGVFCGMVEEIESLGFDHLWLTDSSLHARNCYSYLTLAATRSSRLLIGTAVTNTATRHPAITAVAAATVDEIAAGRLILGIGAGDRPLLALGLEPSRLATVEAAISAIDRKSTRLNSRH